MDILLLKFRLKFLQLCIILLKLLNEIINNGLELITSHTTLTNLLTQLGNKLAIVLHYLGNATDIIPNLFSLIGSLPALYDSHHTLGSIYQPKALLNLIHRAKDIIYLPILEINNLLKGITYRVIFLNNRRILLLLTRSQKKNKCQYREKFLQNF